ncbi:MAG: hypothetical protein HY611_07200, partial [Elusimicrobia bacterium]|nr:hypothetical protein [Elusimicrobiota bacterium]
QALRIDAQGNIWQAIFNEDCYSDVCSPIQNPRIEKYSASAVFISSTALPGLGDEGISIDFDASGNAWVSAGVDTPAGQNLAVYRVHSSGSALLSSATYNSPFNLDEFGRLAVDGADNAWIGGVIQIAGSSSTHSGSDDPNNRYKFGLWKYDGSLFALTTTYERTPNGVAGGLDTAVDGSGNIWSVGVSSSLSQALDLTLWKYDSSGNPVSGFPKFAGNYWPTLDELDMKIGINGGVVWVAANKSNGNDTDLALLKYDLGGNLLSSSLWRRTDLSNSDDRPRDMGFDASGNVWIVGESGVEYEGGGSSERLTAVWKYNSSNQLAPGYPQQAGEGQSQHDVRAIALSASGAVWINSGDRPALFTGGNTIPGSTGIEVFSAEIAPAAFSNVTDVSLQANWTGLLPSGSLFHAWISTHPSLVPVYRSVSGGNTFAEFTGLTPNTLYYGAVSTTAAGASSYTSLGSTRTLLFQLTAAPLSDVSYTSLRANWTSNIPAGPLYYAWISTNSNLSPAFRSASTSGLYADFSGLDQGTLYYAAVSTTSVGAAAYTALGSTRTLMLTPLNAFFSFISPRSLSVAWDSIGNAAYTAVLARDSGFSSVVSTRALGSNSTAYFDLAPQTAYFFKVRLSTDPVFNSAISTSTLPLPPPSFTGDFSRYEGALYDSGEVDRAAAVAVDSITAGGPYVYTLGSTSGTIAGQQWVIIKYDSQGIKLASATVQDPGTGSWTWPYSASVDSSGRLYISGTFNNNTGRLIQYSSNLTPLKTVDLASVSAHHSEVFETGGNAFVYSARRLSGSIEVVKYDSNLVGVATGTLSTSGDLAGLAVGPSGDAYVLGRECCGGNSLRMLRFDSNLNFVSSITVGGSLINSSGNNTIAAGGSGSVFITGYDSSYNNAVTHKYDSSLNLLASTTAFNRGSGNSIAVDRADGTVYVASWGQVLRYSNALNQLINSGPSQ